jgi:hypothetical protein
MVKKLKISIDEDRYDKIVGMDIKFQNNNISQTVREIMDKGFDSIETAFLIKEIVLSSLNSMERIMKEQNKIIKEQSNRIAQLEIKTLKEATTTKAIFKEFIEFGSLSKDDIERIEKATHRALFESLNSKKDKAE